MTTIKELMRMQEDLRLLELQYELTAKDISDYRWESCGDIVRRINKRRKKTKEIG